MKRLFICHRNPVDENDKKEEEEEEEKSVAFEESAARPQGPQQRSECHGHFCFCLSFNDSLPSFFGVVCFSFSVFCPDGFFFSRFIAFCPRND